MKILMLDKLTQTLAFAAISLIATCSAIAESAISTTLAVTSDYVADGVSQSDSKPVFQMGVDYEHDRGVYAGLWASRIDSDTANTPNIELDFATGYASDVTDKLGVDLGITQYTYHHVDDKEATNYHEWYLGLKAFKNASIYYYYADDNDVWNGIQERIIASYTQPMTKNLSLFVLAERLNYERSFGNDYSAYQLGVVKNWMDTDFMLSYWHNTIDGGGDVATNRFVLEVSRKFDVVSF